jgi:carbon monoxide dehydrogenase subunit G
MARNSIDVAAVPETVWEVLADANTYGEWVVGTKNVAGSDAHWPEPGAELEYELGLGPLSVADHTVVVEADAPRTLVLRAEFRHFGAFMIRLELEPAGGGTRVTMDEAPVDSMLGAKRVVGTALQLRNDVALARLQALAEARR